MTATLDATGVDESAGGTPNDEAVVAEAAPPSAPPRSVPAALAPWRDPHPAIGWLVTAAITALAIVTRFWALGFPPGRNSVPHNGMNFDEVYYTVEAQELLRFGYEDNRGYMFIVHPPLGKWLIAASEWLWDSSHTWTEYLSNSLGWRLAPATAGVLGVVMITRIARRIFRSNLFGGIAGLLMALEGMSLVLARTAILDIFLQMFVIAGFGALVLDRDSMRARLAALVADGADLTAGAPTLGPRPWRVVGGVMLGLACAVKWTGLSFFVLFAILSLVWDRAALKSAGVRRPTRSWSGRALLPGLGSLVATPVVAYLLCWLGWFAGENSWNRHWADTHGTSARLDLFGLRVPFSWAWVPGPIRSLGQYHYEAYTFHEGLDSGHAYASGPWSWMVLGRPVDFYYESSKNVCGAPSCSREVLLIGTPLMWWAFAPVVLWLAWHWLTTRDWRAASVLVAFAAGWLVWFQDLKRTAFLFYMAPLVPFLILGLTLAIGAALGPAERGPGPISRRRAWGVAAVSVYLALVVADFVWMWPLFTGGLLTNAQWHMRMWFPSWI